MKRKLLILPLLMAGPLCVAAAAAQERRGAKDDSVAYQINVAHSGSIDFKAGFAAPLRQLWSINLGGSVSYPLIAEQKVFVTAKNLGDSGTNLFALDRRTGKTLWSAAIIGSYHWSNAAYDEGKVFVVNVDGLMQAFDTTTGTFLWQTQLPGQYFFSSAPTAYNGQVYTAGSGFGGTLYGVDEATGNVKWTQGVDNGGPSDPSIGDNGLYVSYPCQVYKFGLLTGHPLWHYDSGCEGGGGRTTVFSRQQVFSRETGTKFDAKTGDLEGGFASVPALAFFNDVAGNQRGLFLQVNGTLYCRNRADYKLIWSFVGDRHLSSAPIVINGNVVEGSGKGELYMLDGQTGDVLWSVNVGARIAAPDEDHVVAPLTGLGAGQGTLVVPAEKQLSAYVPQ